MKTVGILMILAISLLVSAIICKYEKYKITYCEKMIFLANQVKIMLKTVLPETDVIFSVLKKSERLKGIDLSDISSTSPLGSEENEKIIDFVNSIGKYDAQTQIKKTDEFCESFRLLKENYQQYYSSHYKIIYAFGFGVGSAIAVLLI